MTSPQAKQKHNKLMWTRRVTSRTPLLTLMMRGHISFLKSRLVLSGL